LEVVVVEEEAREAEEVEVERVCVPAPSSFPTGAPGEDLIRPAEPLLLLLLLPKVTDTLRGFTVLLVVDLPALPTRVRGWGAGVGVGMGALNAALSPVTGDGASGAPREAAAASFSSAAAAATAVARRWRWGRKTMFGGGGWFVGGCCGWGGGKTGGTVSACADHLML